MLVTWIEKMFKHSFDRKWYETYWAFDIHGVISVPTHRKNDGKVIFYPYAKETLQLVTERKDIVMIMSTSSYPSEIKKYNKIFKENNIHFKYINENPDISTAKGSFGHYKQKFYFNVMFEDKAGFDPLTEWKPIYNLLKKYEKENYLPDPVWKT